MSEVNSQYGKARPKLLHNGGGYLVGVPCDKAFLRLAEDAGQAGLTTTADPSTRFPLQPSRAIHVLQDKQQDKPGDPAAPQQPSGVPPATPAPPQATPGGPQPTPAAPQEQPVGASVPRASALKTPRASGKVGCSTGLISFCYA